MRLTRISNDFSSYQSIISFYKLFSGQFPGTIITIKFKTDDTHHYSLRNEEKINLDNIF